MSRDSFCAGDAEAYGSFAKGRVVEGGALCASRNRAIDVARDEGYDYVLELSDDLDGTKCQVLKFEDRALEETTPLQAYALTDKRKFVKPRLRERKTDESELPTCNEFAKERLASTSVPATARLVAAVLGKHPDAKLAGVAPIANPGLYVESVPVATDLFVVGDFVVIDASTELRFDERMTLKEDYAFTAANLSRYGMVVRLNKVFVRFSHYSNAGGAVAVRGKVDQTSAQHKEPNEAEQRNIRLLHHNWPGAFRQHRSRGVNEVELQWSKRGKLIGGTRDVPRGELLPTDDLENIPPPSSARKTTGGDNQRKITAFFSRSSTGSGSTKKKRPASSSSSSSPPASSSAKKKQRTSS